MGGTAQPALLLPLLQLRPAVLLVLMQQVLALLLPLLLLVAAVDTAGNPAPRGLWWRMTGAREGWGSGAGRHLFGNGVSRGIPCHKES
jgi:hypothetical protein